MSADKPGVGMVGWRDLTVDNAEEVRDFYEAVIGWTHQPVSMGEYNDYSMVPPGTDDGVAGICHARGTNQGLPAQWLLYFVVADLAASVEICVQQGGMVVRAPKTMGPGQFCIIQDPSGAVCALYQAE